MLARTDEFPTLSTIPRAARGETHLALFAGAAVLLLALALPVATTDGRAIAPSPSHAPTTQRNVQTDFTLRPSHGGAYRAEVAVAPPVIAVGAAATWVFRVTRRNHRRLASASVALQTRLVDRGDSATATLPARYVGESRYEVRDVRLTEPGWWNLALVIRGAWGTDSVAFNVVIDR